MSSEAPINIKERLIEILREAYGQGPDAVKRLARDAGCTPRTAENWLAGKTQPQSAFYIRIMSRNEAVTEAFFALVHARRAERYPTK